MKNVLMALLLAWAVPALAAPREPVASARGAIEVVERAVAAHGGPERIRAPKSTRLEISGRIALVGQNRIAGVAEEGLDASSTLMIDHAGGRWRLDGENRYHGGYRFRSRTTLTPAAGASENVSRYGPGEFVTPIAPADLAATRLGMAWTLPHLIVAELAERPGSLRFVAATPTQLVLAYARANGSLVDLRFSRTSGLLEGYASAATDPTLGDVDVTTTFLDYAERDGILVPRRRVVQVGESRTRDDRYVVAFDVALADSDFAVPVAPAPRPAPPELEPLGDGVVLVRNVMGYNALAVEFADHVVVVEAPVNSAAARIVLERVGRAFPGKPVRSLVLTHHHADHVGGLREFVAAGATLHVPAGTSESLRRIATASFRLRPDTLARAPREPKLDEVAERSTLSDGRQEMHLIPYGPTSHAGSMLLVWLPKQRVVFQGDMLILPDVGIANPIEVNRELAALLARLAIEPLAIAGAHGRVGDAADLAETLAKGEQGAVAP